VSAGEVIEMVVACRPDAPRGVLVDVDYQTLLNAFGCAEAVKLRAVVAEESVLGGAPEKTCLILDELEDIVVLQALILPIVLEGKLLCAGTDCRNEDERHEREQRYGKSQGRKLSGSVGPGQDSSLVAHLDANGLVASDGSFAKMDCSSPAPCLDDQSQPDRAWSYRIIPDTYQVAKF
jgi:hypothetical protein